MMALPIERAGTRRRITWLTVVGVILLPVLIGAVLVGALWNPTERLDNMRAAIVNLDEPVKVQGQLAPLGRQLTAGLVEGSDTADSNVDWVLSNRKDAKAGLADGSYQAVVTIPKNFSKAATSTTTTTPEQAKIDVQTADDARLLDGMITNQIATVAATSMGRELSSVYLENVLLGFTTMNEKLGDAAKGAHELQSGASSATTGAKGLADGTVKLSDGVNALSAGASQLSTGTGSLAGGAHELAGGAGELSTGVGALATGADGLAGGAGSLSTGAGALADGSQQLAAGLGTLSGGVAGAVNGLGTLSGALREKAKDPEIPPILPAEFLAAVDSAATKTAAIGTGVGTAAVTAGTAATSATDAATQAATAATAVSGVADPASQAAAAASGASASADSAAASTVTLSTDLAALVASCADSGASAAFCDQVAAAASTATTAADDAASASTSLAGVSTPATTAAAAAADAKTAADAAAASATAAATAAGTAATSAGAAAGSVKDAATAAGTVQAYVNGVPGQPGLKDAIPAGFATAVSAALTGAADGVDQAKRQMAPLVTGAGTVASSGQQLATGTSQLAAGAGELASGAGAFADGTSQVAAGAGSLATGAGTLADGADQLATGASQLSDGVSQTAAGTGELATGSSKLADGVGKLADGTGTLADGLTTAVDGIPTYTESQAKGMATVVADPVQASEQTGGLYGGAAAPLLAVVALWFGGLASYVAIQARTRRTLASSAASPLLALRAFAPAAVIGAVQGLLVAIVVQIAAGYGVGTFFGVAGLAIAAGVTFAAVHQALVALLGGTGRWIAAIAGVLFFATGIISTTPNWLAGLAGVLPTSPAYTAMLGVTTGAAVGGAITQLVLWTVLSLLATTFAVARRRSVSAAQAASLALA